MIRKLSNFCLFFVLIQLSLFAETTYNSNAIACSPRLQHVLSVIEKVPEARQLIAEIQQEGPIRILVNQHELSQKFGAFWDMEQRTICVNLPWHYTDGEVIGSIIFELHNASINSSLEYYDRLAENGQISRNDYVEAIEKLEYQNSLRAASLAEAGIQQGHFPYNARLPTYSNFEEHYHYQKIGGHSAWIGKNYDQLRR